MATTVPAGLMRPSTGPVGSPPGRVRARRALPGLPQAIVAADARAVVVQWVVSRAIALALMTTVDNAASGDVLYYARSLSTMFHGGSVHQTLQEYPLPVLGIMLPQYLLGGMSMVGFELLFVLSMLALDGGFARMLWRHGGDTRTPALNLWLWFVPLTGAIADFRFDLVPGVLSGAALLVAARRPAGAAGATAVGALLKLWPGLTVLVFLVNRTGRRRVLISFLASCSVVTVSCLAIGGWGRLVSPLQWQSRRGLQIESVAAGPLMLGRALHPDHVWDVRISPYKAAEIFGWGVTALITVSTLATVLAVGWVVWVFRRAVRLGTPVLPATLAWMLLAIAMLLTVTNKTLSPQYILWLGAPLAALLMFDPHDPAARRAGRLLLVIAVMTHLIFPMFYAGLMNIWWATFPTTVLLESRNVLLVWLTWIACREVVRRTAPEALGAAGSRIGTAELHASA